MMASGGSQRLWLIKTILCLGLSALGVAIYDIGRAFFVW
jgi:hypothetical protein